MNHKIKAVLDINCRVVYTMKKMFYMCICVLLMIARDIQLMYSKNHINMSTKYNFLLFEM